MHSPNNSSVVSDILSYDELTPPNKTTTLKLGPLPNTTAEWPHRGVMVSGAVTCKNMGGCPLSALKASIDKANIVASNSYLQQCCHMYVLLHIAGNCCRRQFQATGYFWQKLLRRSKGPTLTWYQWTQAQVYTEHFTHALCVWAEKCATLVRWLLRQSLDGQKNGWQTYSTIRRKTLPLQNFQGPLPGPHTSISSPSSPFSQHSSKKSS